MLLFVKNFAHFAAILRGRFKNCILNYNIKPEISFHTFFIGQQMSQFNSLINYQMVKRYVIS